MKTWTCIAAATAILAVAAQAGFSATSNVPSDPGSNGGASLVWYYPGGITDGTKSRLVKTELKAKTQAARIRALVAKKKALAARNKALVARNKAKAARNAELSARIQALTPTPPRSDSGTLQQGDDSCISYTLCTPEEDCLIWGNNCDLVSRPITTATTTATDQSSTVTPPAQPVANSSAGGSQSSGPSGASQSSGLECVSLVDPGLSLAYADSYDWTC